MQRTGDQGGKDPEGRKFLVAYFKGVDYFLSDHTKPAIKRIKCAACHEKLAGVKREEYGSFASAMAKLTHMYWVYACPNVQRKGHEHLVELVKEMDDLKSKALGKLVRTELSQEIKKFRKMIKKGKVK
jgi:hypothetical protein